MDDFGNSLLSRHDWNNLQLKAALFWMSGIADHMDFPDETLRFFRLIA